MSEPCICGRATRGASNIPALDYNFLWRRNIIRQPQTCFSHLHTISLALRWGSWFARDFVFLISGDMLTIFSLAYMYIHTYMRVCVCEKDCARACVCVAERIHVYSLSCYIPLFSTPTSLCQVIYACIDFGVYSGDRVGIWAKVNGFPCVTRQNGYHLTALHSHGAPTHARLDRPSWYTWLLKPLCYPINPYFLLPPLPAHLHSR